ncbi:hypothetical protein D9758_013382 [Tetrapyrgos nigripes]|uniref:7alpha-cephem-methoxylase P8 chain n=1 Tax=Tetrapyrgos nigripes TaxID=182062 RepID=A0A8H5CKY0_9AGAR|nr:hypothetical protein D9758_013382 [Tetrapyrgos nigripes]
MMVEPSTFADEDCRLVIFRSLQNRDGQQTMATSIEKSSPYTLSTNTMPATLIQPSFVSASLRFFTPPSDGSRPFIENLRGKESSVSLDTAGFQFYNEPAKHKSFKNDEEIKREYYPESIELIKKLTGASRVVLFDHTTRRRRPGVSGADPSNRQPAAMVHGDQTARAARNRVLRHLPESESGELLKHRYQIINLWRPISHPAYDWPLALADYRSVDAEKGLTPVAFFHPGREENRETMGVSYNPALKFKYLRGMTPDEIVLIKCYDSKDDGSVAIMTPHTAFEDPTTPADALFRESIELRALVFYDD